MDEFVFAGRSARVSYRSTKTRTRVMISFFYPSCSFCQKSRLINFFASKCTKNKLWDFAGLAPQDGMDDQSQRDHFARQLASHLKLPPFTFQDWTDAFEHLSIHIKAGDIVLLDEICC